MVLSELRQKGVTTNMKLNPEQQAAADFLDGICVVVAVPGSGKRSQ